MIRSIFIDWEDKIDWKVVIYPARPTRRENKEIEYRMKRLGERIARK